MDFMIVLIGKNKPSIYMILPYQIAEITALTTKMIASSWLALRILDADSCFAVIPGDEGCLHGHICVTVHRRDRALCETR